MATLSPGLEKLLLKGKATYRVLNHAFGMYGKLPLPESKIGIIVNITWYPFLNPVRKISEGLTYNEFLNYNEYQLKIDGKKGLNFYHFRNLVNWKLTNAGAVLNLTGTLNSNFVKSSMAFSPSAPIQHDCYIVCEEYIKLTISRNAMVDSITNNYGLLTNAADEQKAPNGMGNINTLLQATMNDIANDQMTYQPPRRVDSGVAVTDRTSENYTQDLHPAAHNSYNSQLSEVQDMKDTLTDLPPLSPYLMYPLINFGVVIINLNDYDQLMND